MTTGFSVPIVAIVTIIIIGLSVISGALKGFASKISGILALVLALILVNLFLPGITSALRNTPVYTFIRQRCAEVGENIAGNAVSSMLTGTGGLSGGTISPADAAAAVNSVSADDGSGRLDRDKIKAKLIEYGYDPSLIDSMSDADLQAYAQQLIGVSAGAMSQPAELMGIIGGTMTVHPAFLSVSEPGDLCASSMSGTEYILAASMSGTAAPYAAASEGTAVSSGGGLLSQLTGSMSRTDQIRFIESLPLPEKLKEQMVTFNNAEGYKKLNASDFGSYVVSYIANLILNAAAFLVTLLVVWIIIRLILTALSIFRNLPIIGAADRLLGAGLGLVQGILIMWVLFLLLSLAATTSFGTALMEEINRTPVLKLLYDSNLLMNSATDALRGLM